MKDIQKLIDEGKRVFNDEIKAIGNAVDFLNEDFAEAVIKIAEAKRVIVSGVGKSGIIGKKIAATLSSVGVPSFFIHPVEALHGDIGMVQNDDVAILLSKSGSTDEIVKFIPYLKMRNSFIISIVGNMASYMARNSNIPLNAEVEREACALNLAPTSSTTLALVIGDALAVAAMKYLNVTREDFAKLHPLGQLGRNITLRIKDVMHQGSDLPIVTEDMPFKEALIEMTRKALGCICIIDENKNLKGIITDGDVRRILQKNDDIRNLMVADVMTSDPINISQDYFLGEAMSLMENRESQINVLPVTENKKLIGVIRIHDIIRSGL